MQIKITPRIFFEARRGTPAELPLLEQFRIISINSRNPAETPPFSRKHPHLLTLFFDDVIEDVFNAMQESDAAKIQVFLRQTPPLPLIVHCKTGISRSGAVGEVLNWYFNRFLRQNESDFRLFFRLNPDIEPNPLVYHKLLTFLVKHEAQRGG